MQAGLSALHIITSLFYLSGLVLLVYVFLPAWDRFRRYAYFYNFKMEFISALLRVINLSLMLSLSSGAAIIFLAEPGQPVLPVIRKISALCLVIVLSIPFLRIFPESETSDVITMPSTGGFLFRFADENPELLRILLASAILLLLILSFQ